jgi:hypothetical protein
MQRNIRLLSVITLTLFITLIACKKDSSQQQEEQDPKLTAHTEDQSRFSNVMDAADLEVNYALESSSSFSGRLMGDSICAATVVYDTLNSTRKITITYNGADCGGFSSRTGSIVISMASGVRWKDAGAQINVTFQNFKVVRTRDNKSVTINGTHTLTNVEGGLLRDLLQGRTTIVHTISGDLSITFDDGTQRSWQVARKRVYTLANGGTITITGTHTDGTQTNIAEWGTDRFGIPFTTSITQPLVISANCQFRLTSGQVQHNRLASSASVTFGLDKNGAATTCPASGSFYYKLTWTGPGGNTLTYIAPY